jgi:hypothetical protein
MQRAIAPVLCCTLAVAFAASLPRQAASAQTAKSTAAAARGKQVTHRRRGQGPSEQHWKNVYKLELEFGSPVVMDYWLDGYHLKPTIDTGVPSELAVSPSLFSKLHQTEPCKHAIASFAGKSKDHDSALTVVPLLGSGRRRWYDVVAVDEVDEPGAISNAICSLDLLDGNVAMFLLSRKQLYVGYGGPAAGATGSAGGLDSPDIKALPYFANPEGMFVTLKCEGKYYCAIVDTGSWNTSFFDNFIAQHPAEFTASGKTEPSEGIDAEMDLPVYHYTGGIVIEGCDADSDVALTPCDCDALPAFDFEGNPAAAGTSGDFSSLPYARPDTPDIAPVALIGMDLLGKYDFCFYRNQLLLLLWPPAETDKMFPRPDKRAAGRRAHSRRAAPQS